MSCSRASRAGLRMAFWKEPTTSSWWKARSRKAAACIWAASKQILRDGVVCELEAPLKRGDGIVFDAGDPTKKEEGGRVYDLRRKGVKLEGEAARAGLIDIVPGRNDVDLGRVHVGDRIWKTNDPALDKRLRQTFRDGEAVSGVPGSCAGERACWRAARHAGGRMCRRDDCPVDSELELEQAQKRPMDDSAARRAIRSSRRHGVPA